MRLDDRLVTDNVRLHAGEAYTATVSVADEQESSLGFEWRLMRESEATEAGGDKEEVLRDLFFCQPCPQSAACISRNRLAVRSNSNVPVPSI